MRVSQAQLPSNGFCESACTPVLFNGYIPSRREGKSKFTHTKRFTEV